MSTVGTQSATVSDSRPESLRAGSLPKSRLKRSPISSSSLMGCAFSNRNMVPINLLLSCSHLLIWDRAVPAPLSQTSAGNQYFRDGLEFDVESGSLPTGITDRHPVDSSLIRCIL